MMSVARTGRVSRPVMTWLVSAAATACSISRCAVTPKRFRNFRSSRLNSSWSMGQLSARRQRDRLLEDPDLGGEEKPDHRGVVARGNQHHQRLGVGAPGRAARLLL